MLNPVEIIAAKRDGQELNAAEIKYFIEGFVAGKIPDYQMAAFLMTVFLQSMAPEETISLTKAMLESGRKIVFDPSDKSYVDKHSTGGIGDKVSIILAPLMAACGLKVPMLSGRGLGHTGGTLDKLEAIPGFRTNLSIDEFKAGVEKIGCVISGQTPEIAPADRMMYALRDVTGTVESIPLICASILSKKFAAGPNSIVFDIKCGNGAFMKTAKDAKRLGSNLCEICQAMNVGSAYLVTDMNQPLGRAAGNALEIDECVMALHGDGPADLMEITFALGACLLLLAGAASNGEAMALQKKRLDDGSAFAKFLEMVAYQGGNASKLETGRPLAPARDIIVIRAKKVGYIGSIDAFKLGRLVVLMGGGRIVKDDAIDPTVGFIMHKKIGAEVSRGEIMLEVHSSGKLAKEYIERAFADCIYIEDEGIQPPPLIKA